MTNGEMSAQKQEIGGTALVIGGGSIGQRHAAILGGLGMTVRQVSGHLPGAFRTLEEALANGLPDYAVVASLTSRHLADTECLRQAGFRGPLLVEKPLFAPGQGNPGVLRNLRVAYQLRFHPALQWLKRELGETRAVSVQAYVGQYLPSWRPGRNYRETESASAAAGGGALNDLSHELDLMDWLFGGWRSVAALGGRDSSLEIETDDHFALLCRFERCTAATLELNYLDRSGRRRIVVNADEATLEVDLIRGECRRNDDPPFSFVVDRDGPLRDMHCAVVAGDATPTDLGSAARTMSLIEASLQSAREQRVVTPP